MFDSGVPDQFHQFISSRNPIPLPLAFPLHGVASSSSAAAATPAAPSFPGFFDPYSQTLPPPPNHPHHHQSGLQQLHQKQSTTAKNDEEKEEASSLLSTNLRLDQIRERSIKNHPIDDSWSNDEVLALLRIRSSFEIWFPEFTWEHVSRKLGELGFQRSAEKCKEKFEEESRQFNSKNYNKTDRFFSELDELYRGENPPPVPGEKIQNLEKENYKADEGKMDLDPNSEEDVRTAAVSNHSQGNEELVVMKPMKTKKRKRKEKFEMFKGFCEALVEKIMVRQEELNKKIIQDLMKREEEHISREEAWRRQEIEWINKETEMRARERAIAGERQAKIIEFLKKLTADSLDDQNLRKRIDNFVKVTNSSATSSSEFLPHKINTPSHQLSNDQGKLEVATSTNMVISHQNPTFLLSQNSPSLPPSSSETPSTQNHTSNPTIDFPKATSPSMASQQNPNDATQVHVNPLASSPPSLASKFASTTNERGDRDIGKRWPRDEVLALINLKCNLNNHNEDKKEASKGPLWERISQGMLEFGYKRSAKRCKEKWENINKYFRKTKDNKKKRSMDSRTCPYFHQLSSLYNQGTPADASDAPENCQT